MSTVKQLATRRAKTAVCAINFNEKLTALPARLTALSATYLRNTSKRVLQDGALVTLSNNQFGTTYDPVTGKYAFLAELAATNLATYSEGAAANWSVLAVTDGTTFFGRTNALYFADNSTQRSAFKTITAANGTTYSLSVYVKMDDLSTPVVGTTTTTGDFGIIINSTLTTNASLIVDCGNGVYRVSSYFTATSANSSFGIIKYVGQSSKGFHITAIQVETGFKATSYILTTTATATRNRDELSFLLSNVVGFDSANYMLYAQARQDAAAFATASELLTISDSSNNNRSMLRMTSALAPRVVSQTSGATQATYTFSGVSTAVFKVAGSFSVNDFLTSSAGAQGTRGGAGTMPLNLAEIHIGSSGVEVAQFNGLIFEVNLITRKGTQGEVNGLTA